MTNFHCTSLDTLVADAFKKVFKKFNKLSLTWPFILSLSRFRFLLSFSISLSVWPGGRFSSSLCMYTAFSFNLRLQNETSSVCCMIILLCGLVAYFHLCIYYIEYIPVHISMYVNVNINKAGHWFVYAKFIHEMSPSSF